MHDLEAAAAVILPFESVITDNAEQTEPTEENKENTEPKPVNAAHLPRISDNEHFKRAVESGAPHSYIAARAGRMKYQREDGSFEDGLGMMNAEELHLRVFMIRHYTPNGADIEKAKRLSVSFISAAAALPRRSEKTHQTLQALMPDEFPVSKVRAPDLHR